MRTRGTRRRRGLAAAALALALAAWPRGATGAPGGALPPGPAPPPRPAGLDRSYLARLERQLLQATQFANRQPNGPQLWAAARSAMLDLLMQEWRAGRLVGLRPEQAFAARCDPTTMTQADVAAGKLVCVVEVAVRRPAEFELIRLVQWTGGRRRAP